MVKLLPIGIYASKPGMGKTTVAQWLVENHGYQKISFASPIKTMAWQLLSAAGFTDEQIHMYMYDPELKNTAIIPGIGVTMRHILQTLGTDWGREKINRNLWVNIALQRAQNLDEGGIVIDDMRFPNEYDQILDSGYVLRIVRAVPDHSNAHASEGALDNFEFDFVIENNGTKAELYAQLANLFPPGFFRDLLCC